MAKKKEHKGSTQARAPKTNHPSKIGRHSRIAPGGSDGAQGRSGGERAGAEGGVG